MMRQQSTAVSPRTARSGSPSRTPASTSPYAGSRPGLRSVSMLTRSMAIGLFSPLTFTSNAMASGLRTSRSRSGATSPMSPVGTCGAGLNVSTTSLRATPMDLPERNRNGTPTQRQVVHLQHDLSQRLGFACGVHPGFVNVVGRLPAAHGAVAVSGTAGGSGRVIAPDSARAQHLGLGFTQVE